MEDVKTEHKYSQDGDKFIMEDTTIMKIVKSQKLQNVFLADGKTVLPCTEGLLEGEESCLIEDKGEHYEQTITTKVRFQANFFLRFVTTIRQMHDKLISSKDSFEYFDKELKDLEPFIKAAGEVNKKVENILKIAAEENNEVMK